MARTTTAKKKTGVLIGCGALALAVLFVVASVFFAFMHYVVDNSHELAQTAAVSHPVIRKTVGVPFEANPRFCWSALGRHEVRQNVAIDEHSFTLAGKGGEWRVDVDVEATNRTYQTYEVLSMKLERDGKSIVLDVSALPDKARKYSTFPTE